MGLVPLLVASGDHDWRPVQTCSFEDPPPPHQYWHLVAKAHMLGKQAVRILLECFLVLLYYCLRFLDSLDLKSSYLINCSINIILDSSTILIYFFRSICGKNIKFEVQNQLPSKLYLPTLPVKAKSETESKIQW